MLMLHPLSVPQRFLIWQSSWSHLHDNQPFASSYPLVEPGKKLLHLELKSTLDFHVKQKKTKINEIFKILMKVAEETNIYNVKH